MVQNSAMSALDAWMATTAGAAQLLGVDAELGTLAPGTRADVVLLEGDFDDLDKLAGRIAGVWKDGVPAFGEAPTVPA